MQHCWPTAPSVVGCYMLRLFAHPAACCCMLLRVVGSCGAQVETGRTFERASARISFVP